MKILLTALVIIVSMGTAGSVCAQDFQKGVDSSQWCLPSVTSIVGSRLHSAGSVVELGGTQ